MSINRLHETHDSAPFGTPFCDVAADESWEWLGNPSTAQRAWLDFTRQRAATTLPLARAEGG